MSWSVQFLGGVGGTSAISLTGITLPAGTGIMALVMEQHTSTNGTGFSDGGSNTYSQGQVIGGGTNGTNPPRTTNFYHIGIAALTSATMTYTVAAGGSNAAMLVWAINGQGTNAHDSSNGAAAQSTTAVASSTVQTTSGPVINSIFFGALTIGSSGRTFTLTGAPPGSGWIGMQTVTQNSIQLTGWYANNSAAGNFFTLGATWSGATVTYSTILDGFNPGTGNRYWDDKTRTINNKPRNRSYIRR